MQNQSEREKLILQISKLRKQYKNNKKVELYEKIINLEDKLRVLEFDGDENIGRFSVI